MRHDIAGRNIAPRLDAALGVDCSVDVGEVAEEVEAVEQTDEVAVKETFGDTSVPDKFVCIHCVVGIATAGVHGGRWRVGGSTAVRLER